MTTFKLCFLLVTFSVALQAKLNRPIPPMTKDVIHGSWAGYDISSTDFFYLTFAPNGTGKLTVVHPYNVNELYVISWKWIDGRVPVSIEPRQKSEPVSVMIDVVDYTRLSIEVKGASTNKWERKAILWNEREMLQRIAAGKKAAESER